MFYVTLIHSWAPLYPSFFFKNEYVDQNCTKIYIFVFYFVDFVKLAQYELYKFDCNPYAKFLNSTFEYYNYIKV